MSSIFGKLAGGVVKLAEQAGRAAIGAIDRLANRQEFEAVVAACALVASADGSSDEQERAAAIAQAAAHPALSGFTSSEVQTEFKDCHALLGMDKTLGTQTLLERVGKITDLQARTRIVSIAAAIASADGDFSEPEKQMVERIRNGR